MIPLKVPRIPGRPYHDPIGPLTYDLGFWALRDLLPPPLGGPLPPMSKGPPLSLLIGTLQPLVGSPPSSLIGDGMPLCSMYNFPIGKFKPSVGYVCF